MQTNMEFVFKEFRAAVCVADVFGCIASRGNLEAYRAALEFGVDRIHALAMRMIEPFGDSEYRRKPACKALIGIVQRAVGRMIAGGFGLAVVVTNGSGDDVSLAAIEPGDVAIQRKIFAVLVMAFVADGVAYVMKQCSRFKQHARISRKVMHRLQLIKKLEADFANVFRVAAVAVEAAGKNSRSAEHLARFGIVSVRFFAREGFAGDLAEETFPNSDTGNRKRAEIQVTAKRKKDQTGNPHDIGAIAADAIDFHARIYVASKKIGETLAEKRKLKCAEPMFARAGSKVSQRFGVATQCDGKFVAEIGARRKSGFEKSSQIFANLIGLGRRNRASNSKSCHQANRAHRELRGLHHAVIAKNADFEAAAAEVGDAAKRRFGAERGKDGFPAEAGFFRGTDDFETKF